MQGWNILGWFLCIRHAYEIWKFSWEADGIWNEAPHHKVCLYKSKLYVTAVTMSCSSNFIQEVAGFFLQLCLWVNILFNIVRSCNHYSRFYNYCADSSKPRISTVYGHYIKTQNQCKLRSTLENAKSNPWNDMRIGVNSSFLRVTIRLWKSNYYACSL